MIPTYTKLFTILAIVIFLHSEFNSVNSLRILGIFPLQATSHFIMCKELMKGLAAKGHQVDVYSHFPLPKPVPNYTDFSLQKNQTVLLNNLTYDHINSMKSSIDVINNMLAGSVRSMCKLLEHPYFQNLLHNPPQDPPYDLIILEFCQSHCFIPFGRYLKIPIIGVVTTHTHHMIFAPMASPVNLAMDSISFYNLYAYPMTLAERLHNFFTYYSTRIAFANIISEQDDYMKTIYGPDCPSSVEAVNDFSLILINQHKAINGIRPFIPAIVPVGGLHIADNNETLMKDVQKWLNDSVEGCVYFCLGSLVRLETFPKHIIQGLYKSFKNIAPTRVLLRAVKPELLPPGIPTNVMVKSWFPQIRILKHKNVRVFVTHGGLMDTQEAIYFGVPMIGIPLFVDQFFNIDSCLKRKMALKIYLEELNENSLTQAIKEVLNNNTYKKSAEQVSRRFRDNLLSPVDTAVYWVEYIHRNGKDSLRSPLVDMPWWQLNQFDVYGCLVFLMIAILCTLFVSLKVLKTIFRHKSDVQLKKNT